MSQSGGVGSTGMQRRGFLGAAAALAGAGCAPLPGGARRRFILVHGAWHGGWCWERTAAQLQALGHTVDAPDLPGHGALQAQASEATLARYIERVVVAIDAQPGPVVLVAHSMGGIAVTGAAEARPERVAAAVYVAAYLLPSGASLRDYSGLPENSDSLLTSNMSVSPDRLTATVRPAALREIFYADCSDADVAAAATRVGPQALQPLVAKGAWTPERFGRVPKVYVETSQDWAVRPRLQRRMTTETSVQRVITIDTSHSPFYARPAELAGILARV